MSETRPPVWEAPEGVGTVTRPAAAPPESKPAPGSGEAPVPVTPVVRRATKSRMSGGTVALALGALVAVGGLAFAAGRVTAPAAPARTGAGGFPGASGQPGTGLGGGLVPGGFGSGAFGGVSVSGTVTAVGEGELTIETTSGMEVTIPVDDTTAYHSQAAASSGDVTTGTSVQVQVEVGRGLAPQSSPGALVSPGAGGPGAGGSLEFGTASDVTIVDE